ncbi:MAG: 2-oxo acid dehydrogenase subunit E2, partial [Chloroflexi bacterium]|nr:2-oxo acid dehydrogenase subunit E2 [Chloroflexota bacterium]
LKILTPVNVTVPVLSPVGTLSGGTVSGHHAVSSGEESAKPAPTADSPHPGLTPPKTDSAVRASPKARALARKLNVALEGINGTGIRNMVVAEDVQRLAAKPAVKASPVAQRVAEKTGVDLASVAGSGSGGRIMRADVERALQKQQVAPLPLSGLRGIIAERLSQSWRERPQVTLITDADATNLVAARQQLNAELAAQGEKISYNALLIKLVAQALHEQPNVNVQLTASGLQTMSEINIGLAVDTERGLLVPVIRGALQKSLRQVNAEILALADRAIKGRSLPDDLSGGTFSVTNLGAYEIDAFTPLINPPECAILGVGRIVSKPVGLNGQVVLRDTLALSLSFDHRLIDGAPAARFLQRVKQLIERPFALAL